MRRWAPAAAARAGFLRRRLRALARLPPSLYRQSPRLRLRLRNSRAQPPRRPPLLQNLPRPAVNAVTAVPTIATAVLPTSPLTMRFAMNGMTAIASE